MAYIFLGSPFDPFDTGDGGPDVYINWAGCVVAIAIAVFWALVIWAVWPK